MVLIVGGRQVACGPRSGLFHPIPTCPRALPALGLSSPPAWGSARLDPGCGQPPSRERLLFSQLSESDPDSARQLHARAVTALEMGALRACFEAE